VVDAVKEEVAHLKTQLPDGYTVDVVRDNSVQIRTSADQVLEHLMVGSGLAALVVLLFLGSLRSTVIAAVAIPVSIVSTFGLMMIAGLTLNMMTLLALALAVGIVIDDAIVVLENIYRFIEEKGMKPFPAAIHATKEIGLAVLATTLSLMAVFLPVAFMSGIVGRFLYSFGITMAFAIAVSMVVAFTLTPMMAARMLPVPHKDGEERRKSLFGHIEGAFAKLS
jgi:multidrug efflux pump subunit AcrB